MAISGISTQQLDWLDLPNIVIHLYNMFSES